jgi:hypothetical protein
MTASEAAAALIDNAVMVSLLSGWKQTTGVAAPNIVSEFVYPKRKHMPADEVRGLRRPCVFRWLSP